MPSAGIKPREHYAPLADLMRDCYGYNGVRGIQMKTVAVIGSCLSNLTAAKLMMTYDFKQTHCVHHNRSDVFLKYYVDRATSMIPHSYFDKFVVKPDFRGGAPAILDNQYVEHIGFFQLDDHKRPGKTFFDDLREIKIDLILLDNYMDVAAMLVENVEEPELAGRPLFLNAGFYEEERELATKFHFTPYLTPLESAENWLRIYRWLRALQPEAKIMFLPYHSCSSLMHRQRYERIVGFSSIFPRLASDEDLIVIPPPELGPDLTKGETDWPHFQEVVYHAIAGQVFLNFYGRKAGITPSKQDG